MAQAQAVNIINDEASFGTILQSFQLSIRSRQRFMEDFPTIADLMASTREQVESVLTNQNKTYRNHVTVAQRCYINQPQATRILTLRRFAIIAIKEGGAEYADADTPSFNLAWIDSIQDEYNQKDTEATKPGPLSVSNRTELQRY